MVKFTLAAVLILVVTACGRSSNPVGQVLKQIVPSPAGGAGASPTPSLDAVSKPTVVTDSTAVTNANPVGASGAASGAVGQATTGNLGDASATSPNYVILDSSGLTAVYRRVFAPRIFGAAEILFPASAGPTLGTVDIATPQAAARLAVPVASVTQNYHLYLRSFLNGACSKLVDLELANVADPKNILVKAIDAPSAATLNGFMTRLFGYTPRDGSMHDGAVEYAAVAAANKADFLKSNSTSGAAFSSFIRDTHRFACIAIGEDVRVFLR